MQTLAMASDSNNLLFSAERLFSKIDSYLLSPWFTLFAYAEQILKAKQTTFDLGSFREMPSCPRQSSSCTAASQLLEDRDAVHSFPITLCASNQ